MVSIQLRRYRRTWRRSSASARGSTSRSMRGSTTQWSTRPYFVGRHPRRRTAHGGAPPAGRFMSTWLNTALRPGDVVDVAPPTGSFGTDLDGLAARHLLGITAGSGITR